VDLIDGVSEKKKKIEGVTEYFEIIKLVRIVNLKGKISSNSAKKNSYLPKTILKNK
jgi:hypothetical protein